MPSPWPLPWIWAAARVVPCPFPFPPPASSVEDVSTPFWKVQRLMRPKHVTPLGMKFWEERNLESGLRAMAAGNGTPCSQSLTTAYPPPPGPVTRPGEVSENVREGPQQGRRPSLPTVDEVQPELFRTWTPGPGEAGRWLWLSPAGLPQVQVLPGGDEGKGRFSILPGPQRTPAPAAGPPGRLQAGWT